MSASKSQKERDKAVKHLVDFIIESPKWSPLFDELVIQFMAPVASVLDKDLENIQDDLLNGPYGHMAFLFLFEEMATSYWNNESQTPIDDYLKSRGWREGPAGRQYLRAMLPADLELLEITDIMPGHWLDVRPYGTVAEAKRVVEHAASETLVQWDCIAARILGQGKTRRFAGSILQLNRQAARHIKEQVDAVPEELAELYQELLNDGEAEGVTVDLVDEIEPMQLNRLAETTFMSWAVAVLAETPLPRLSNTDDESLVVTRFRFPLKAKSTEVKNALLQDPGILECEDGRLTWLKAENSPTVQGWISVGEKHMTLETNSVERGTRGVNLIQSLLGERVGAPIGVHENTESLLSEVPMGQPPDPDISMIPEVQAAIQQHFMEHYRKTLDDNIPMLGHESPRVCAADPAKRHKVVDWLKYLENTDQRTPGPAQDFTWMWEELGLTEFR